MMSFCWCMYRAIVFKAKRSSCEELMTRKEESETHTQKQRYRERERETWKIWFEIHSQLDSKKRIIFVSSAQYCSGISNISNDKILTLHEQYHRQFLSRDQQVHITKQKNLFQNKFRMDTSEYLLYQGYCSCSTAEAINICIHSQFPIHDFEGLQKWLL